MGEQILLTPALSDGDPDFTPSILDPDPGLDPTLPSIYIFFILAVSKNICRKSYSSNYA
jgi:hypothetical protein